MDAVIGGTLAIGLGALACTKGHYLYRRFQLGGPLVSPQPPRNSLAPMEKVGDRRMGRSLAILMCYTPNISSYGDLAALLAKDYADMYGYRFILVKTDKRPCSDGRHITWDKIRWMLKVMDGSLREADAAKTTPPPEWVFWMDCDAYFGEIRCMIEQIAAASDWKANLSLCCNSCIAKNVNTGTMLAHNTAWTREFLELLWSEGDPSKRFHKEKYHEQSALDVLLQRNAMECTRNNNIALFTPTSFNSDFMDKKSCSDRVVNGQFIVHRMGTTAEYRVKEFTKVIAKQRGLLFTARLPPPATDTVVRSNAIIEWN